MTVPVVQVRIVRMFMREHAVVVFMRVGLRSVPRKIMLVLMMCVEDMRVRVSECFVAVLVCMAFGQVQRHAGSHQQGRPPKARRCRFAQDEERGRCTEKRSGREIGARTG